MHRLTRKELLLTAVLLFLPAGTLGQSAPPQEVGSLLRQGAEAMRAGNAAEAEAHYKQATVAAPDFAPGWLDLGLAQLKEGKLVDATGSIRHALTLDPSVHGARLFLGIAEYQTQHIDAAVTDLEQAQQEDPENVQVLMWLGIVEMESGHPDKATAPLDRGAELAPNEVGILDYRVQAHMAVARQSYTRLYKLDPGSWRLHRLNAQIDAEARQHTEAIDEYQAAIKIAPKQADLYEGLGWEYRQTGQLDLAQKAFEQQLELTPGNGLSQVYKELGKTVEARAAVEKFQQLHQQAVQARAKDIQDWRKLNAGADSKSAPAPAAQ